MQSVVFVISRGQPASIYIRKAGTATGGIWDGIGNFIIIPVLRSCACYSTSIRFASVTFYGLILLNNSKYNTPPHSLRRRNKIVSNSINVTPPSSDYQH
ncbi:hypothetical protein HanIR_Chr10g0456771 [Helianthus annuus]|nr:hypothetical protein HanIR_Chr10g0456771 [Helianthus annuus]